MSLQGSEGGRFDEEADEQGANHDSDIDDKKQGYVQVPPGGCPVQLPQLGVGFYAITERRIGEGQGFAGLVVGALSLWRTRVRPVKDGWCPGFNALGASAEAFDHRDGRRGIGNVACPRSRTFRLRPAPFDHQSSLAQQDQSPHCLSYHL